MVQVRETHAQLTPVQFFVADGLDNEPKPVSSQIASDRGNMLRWVQAT